MKICKIHRKWRMKKTSFFPYACLRLLCVRACMDFLLLLEILQYLMSLSFKFHKDQSCGFQDICVWSHIFYVFCIFSKFDQWDALNFAHIWFEFWHVLRFSNKTSLYLDAKNNKNKAKQAQICAEGCEGENFTQILWQYCVNIEYLLWNLKKKNYRYCANIVWVLFQGWTNIV